MIRKTVLNLLVAALMCAAPQVEATAADCSPACDGPKSGSSQRLDRALRVLADGGNGLPAPPHVSARVLYPPRGVNWAGALGSADGAGGPPARVDQPFRIASVTKTFVATAVLKLVESRRFTLETPIAGLVAPATAGRLAEAGADPSAISIGQLLTHRSGLFDYAQTPEYVEQVLAAPQRRWTRAEQLELALSVAPPVEPDLVHVYADTNYILLGEILERATGQSLAAALRTLIDYRRLGLRNTWLESEEPAPAGIGPRLHQFLDGVDTHDFDPSFDLYGGGGLVSTTQDLATFFRALLRGRILAPATVAAMTGQIHGGGFAREAYAVGLMPFYIGDTACFGHAGVYGILAAHCPELDYTFVVAAGAPTIAVDTVGRGAGAALAAAMGLDVSLRPFGDNLRRTACTPEFAGSRRVRIFCGMLSVPEDHDRPDGRRIELAAALVQDPTRRPSTAPLLLLGGGPGVPLFPTAAAVLADADLAATLLASQDLVLVEQRGVGESVPSLVCPDPIDDLASAQRCIEANEAAGVDLRQYTTLASTADMELLRRALRIRQWNVLGFSYGTKLMLSMLREHPGTIRSLVLDGVDTPNNSFLTADPPKLTQVLDTIFAGCESRPDCRAAFPALRSRFAASLAEAARAPIVIGENRIDDAGLIGELTAFQVNPERIAYLPAVMDGLARRDPVLLQALFGGVAEEVPASDAEAMYRSVACSDEAPIVDRQALQRMLMSGDAILAAYARSAGTELDICEAWPAGRAPDRARDDVAVRVPTLAFNGEFDLQSPPQTGRALAASQPAVRAIEFRGIGHVATNQATACALVITSRFVRAGQVGVDASCAAALPATQWRTALDPPFYALLGAR